MALGKEFWQKRSLRVRDDVRTRATELTLAQSLYPFCLVTALLFIWGFSYGLLDTLNKHFKNKLGIEKSRSTGLQAAYFGVYPLASLGHAAWILRHFGYRAVFIWGLGLFGLGSLLAIPAIKGKSFGGFCAAFVLGNGLGSLKTAANPYITVCGPPRYAEMRINLSQAFTDMGAAVAPVMGSYVFFTFDNERALENVQWVYLAAASIISVLAVVFFLSDIPEITDADMAFQAAETGVGDGDLPLRKQYRLFYAAVAQFCYAGAQIAIAGYFNYVTETRPEMPSSTASRFLAGVQGAFGIGRYVGALLMHWVRPRILLGVFLTMCIVCTVPAVTLRGDWGMAMLFATMFFESIIFATILALGMKGLGRHTKRGSGYLVAGVSGGACMPPLMGILVDSRGTAFALVVPICFFAVAWTYGLAINFWPSYRDTADAFSRTDVGLRSVEGKGDEQGCEKGKQRSQTVVDVELCAEKVG